SSREGSCLPGGLSQRVAADDREARQRGRGYRTSRTSCAVAGRSCTTIHGTDPRLFLAARTRCTSIRPTRATSWFDWFHPNTNRRPEVWRHGDETVWLLALARDLSGARCTSAQAHGGRADLHQSTAGYAAQRRLQGGQSAERRPGARYRQRAAVVSVDGHPRIPRRSISGAAPAAERSTRSGPR